MTAHRLARSALLVLVAGLSVVLLTSGPGRRSPPPHRALRLADGTVALRAVRSGSGGGPTIVLLHGYGESLVAWRGLFDRVAAHGDVLALDLPGFGLSGKPASGYATEQMAGAVLRALQSLGIERVVLVGHSLGGSVAAAAALAAPQQVVGLVLLDAAGVSAPALLPEPAVGAGNAVRAAIAEYETQRTRFSDVHDSAWLAETPADLAYLPARDSLYRRALTAVLLEFDFGYLTADRVRRIHQPTLVLWGAFDTVIPRSHGDWLAAHLPNARLVVFERAWHRPHVERPAETADTLIAFLRTFQMVGSP